MADPIVLAGLGCSVWSCAVESLCCRVSLSIATVIRISTSPLCLIIKCTRIVATITDKWHQRGLADGEFSAPYEWSRCQLAIHNFYSLISSHVSGCCHPPPLHWLFISVHPFDLLLTAAAACGSERDARRSKAAKSNGLSAERVSQDATICHSERHVFASGREICVKLKNHKHQEWRVATYM